MRRATVILLLLGVVGCRSEGGDTGPGDGDDTSIYAIQDGSVAIGEAVELRGVVVVAVDRYGSRTGGVYVAEPEPHADYGRAFSGVEVYAPGGAADGIEPGDLIDVIGGVVDEHALGCDQPDVDCTNTLQTVTQVVAAPNGSLRLERVGQADIPEPVVVLPQDLASDPALAERWEGVLISFRDVAVVSAPRDVGTDATLQELRLTGPFAVQSALAPFENISRDDCYASVTGVGDYFFSYKLLPRSAADFQAGDANQCLYEVGGQECGDGIDNDFDGFSDCDDFSCQNAQPTDCLPSGGSIVDIQDGSVPAGAQVVLRGVVVTAINQARKGLWVQDAGSDADYSGIRLYRPEPAGPIAADIEVGSIVDVSGTVVEFHGETELEIDVTSADVVASGGNRAPVVRSGMSVSDLADEVRGEVFEGMLVELQNVRVVQPAGEHGGFTVGTAGAELIVDDFLAVLPQGRSADDCLVTLRGVMGYAFDGRMLYPRGAEDIVPGQGCQ